MINLEDNNRLFKASFDHSIWNNEDKIKYLKENINSIESSIKDHLSNIQHDFPDLTDHSLTHSRMLWNYANIIIGETNNFLNPLEAFVLHISFLIHDSGMCYSILNNIEEIKKDALYLDYIKQNGNNENSILDALFYVVRFRHGDYALRVAVDKLSDGNFLISDTKLREELGHIIGKIAKSHTCSINYIDREFGSSYCSPNFPTDWRIDCQKLSYVLRTSDAAHIDNLRTPKSNKLIQEIKGVSKEHWTFQKKLGFPEISTDNLLIYSTSVPFQEREQKAWWYCYEALKVLDKELKSANEFFEIKQQKGFQAKGVKSINDTLNLGKNFIRTEGWTSIDTNIKVTNPIHIATELGGVQLYGNINVAVRELIQNSIDAINLYRLHTGQNNTDVGEIKIVIEKEEDKYFLIITDNGIGMSQSLLTNELLDFGGSYWKSNKFSIDFEGIKTKGFESIGKFGIGFFSVFMLGKNISVTSWKFGESIDKMKTLDFFDGLNSNPLLRSPTISEKNRVIDRGTSIKIELDKNPYDDNGFVGNLLFKQNQLFSLIKYFVPASNVKIRIWELDGTENTILPNHLLNLDYKSFLEFIFLPTENILPVDDISSLQQVNLELIEIKDKENVLGKLILLPELINQSTSLAITISNGIRVNEIGGFVGYVITDDITSIRRDSFSKLISYENMLEWAKKQIEFIKTHNLIDLYYLSYYGLLMTFKLYDEGLPILLKKVENNYSFVSIAEFREDLKKSTEIKIHQEGHTLSTRLSTCNGYIYLHYRFSVNEIIKNDDLEKLLKYNDLIQQIIKEEWSSFEYAMDSLFSKSGYNFEMPYIEIESYTKSKTL